MYDEVWHLINSFWPCFATNPLTILIIIVMIVLVAATKWEIQHNDSQTIVTFTAATIKKDFIPKKPIDRCNH